MDRTRIIIIILCLWAQFSHGQTNVFGKTIWEWGKSPSSRWGASQLVLSLHLDGANWRGLNPFHLSSVNRTTTNTNVVRIERIGQTLNVSLDGTQRWTATTNLITRFKSAVFAAQEAGSNNIIDNFQYNGVTNNFTATNSPDWKFYYEIQPVGSNVQGQVTQARWNAVAQVISGGIANGVMRLGPASNATGELMGGVLAEYTRPLNGDFVMQFEIRKTQSAGHFLIYFPIPAVAPPNPQ